jgi:hypothetical protein
VHISWDNVHASARMRARLMRKIPKPVEFPHRLVDVTNAGPPGHLFAVTGVTATAMGMRPDADGPEEPSVSNAAK